MIKVRNHLRDEYLRSSAASLADTSPLSPLDAEFLALKTAAHGTGFVSPNPLVGAVIVDKDGHLIGVGAHLNIGAAHAEVNAVADVHNRGLNHRLRGATLYCTLEPCAHHGRTPSCAIALAELGLKRVVIGCLDPNPLVNGKGATILRDAGCEIARFSDPNQQECQRLAEVFFHNITTRSVFVGLKVAATLNGVFAHQGDQRHWITSERARQYGHFLRLQYDAIIIGADTLIADNPTLDVRGPLPRKRVPERLVIDPTLRGYAHRTDAALLALHPEKTTWFCREDADRTLQMRLTDLGAKVKPLVDPASGEISAAAILKQLKEDGFQSLLVEGGSATYRTFLGPGRVNRIHCFSAMQIQDGPKALQWSRDHKESIFQNLADVEVTPIERELLIEGKLELTTSERE